MVSKKIVVLVSIIIILSAILVSAWQAYDDLEMSGYDLFVDNLGNTTNEIDNIYISTNSRIYFGNEQDASIYFNGTNLIISG